VRELKKQAIKKRLEAETLRAQEEAQKLQKLEDQLREKEAVKAELKE
jgi:hypothetical protein